jgi:hypothetical protein
VWRPRNLQTFISLKIALLKTEVFSRAYVIYCGVSSFLAADASIIGL